MIANFIVVLGSCLKLDLKKVSRFTSTVLSFTLKPTSSKFSEFLTSVTKILLLYSTDETPYVQQAIVCR